MAARGWITVLCSSGGFQFDGREPVGRSNPGMAETVRAQPDIPVWRKSMSPARASGGKALPRAAARRVSYCVTAMEATALFFAFVIVAFFFQQPIARSSWGVSPGRIFAGPAL